MSGAFEDEKTFEHEAQGLAVFNRRSSNGKRRFFGSALTNHYNTVGFTVSRASRHHHLARDWFHPKEELIEIEFTAAQFAELLTTMNCGVGVPCTIQHVGGRQMAPMPEEPIEAEQVRLGFKDDMARIAKKMGALRDRVAAAMREKTINQEARKGIVGAVESLIQDVQSNLPFIVDSFQEATEKIGTAAKAEVEAFVMHAITSAGLDAVRAMGRGEVDVPALPERAAAAGEGVAK